MRKLLIKHLTGSRANQVDEFPVIGALDLTIGRDATAQVRMDADRDDLVSRRHARILLGKPGSEWCDLVDLQSRNGTFLNRQRVYGTVHISHGDVVQLGAGGPELRLEIDPPPSSVVRPTTEVSVAPFTTSEAKATRGAGAPPFGLAANPRPIGRGTVERIIGEAFTRVKSDSKRLTWIGITALLAIVAVGGSVRYYLRQSEIQQDLAQERNILALQRMNDELKKNPAATEEMKQQITKLESSLKQDDERHRATVQSLLQEINSRAQRNNGPGASAASGDKAPSPRPDPHEPVSGPAQNYSSLMSQARQQLQQGQPKKALELAQQVIQTDRKRWEAYELASQAVAVLGDYGTAVELCRNALHLAPAEDRQEILDRMEDLQTRMAKK